MKPSAFCVLYCKAEIFSKNIEQLSMRGQAQIFLTMNKKFHSCYEIKVREGRRKKFASLQRILFGEDCACEPHWYECGCKRYQHGRDRSKGICVYWNPWGKVEFPNSGIGRLTAP